MKTRKKKPGRVERKVDRLQEQLQQAIHAVKTRRRSAGKEWRAGLKATLAQKLDKLKSRSAKKAEKLAARVATLKAENKALAGELRGLRSSTKKLLRMLGAGLPNLRNETVAPSSNPSTT